jgi:hypothetical protein
MSACVEEQQWAHNWEPSVARVVSTPGAKATGHGFELARPRDFSPGTVFLNKLALDLSCRSTLRTRGVSVLVCVHVVWVSTWVQMLQLEGWGNNNKKKQWAHNTKQITQVVASPVDSGPWPWRDFSWENSLFDTEKTFGSQFNTQSWNVPYPTSAEIYVPRMTLLSEWVCNGVNWDAKRWFCPSFSFVVWTPSLLYRNYCWLARRCFNAISFFNLTWLLLLEYKNDLVFFLTIFAAFF